MKADRGLVQHIEHAHEAAADLRRQPDALGLSPTQGSRRAAQSQILQPHVEQELEPGIDLLEHLSGDGLISLRQLQRDQGGRRVPDRQRAHLVDGAAVHGHRQRQRIEPGALARRAGHLPHVPLDLGPHRVGVRLAVAPLEIGNHALVTGVVAADSPIAVAEADFGALAGDALAVQQQIVVLAIQAPPRLVHGNVPILSHRFHQALEILVVALGPRSDSTVLQAQVGVGNHQLGIHLEHRPQSVARRTRPVGRVEGEVAGGQLLERFAVGGPRQVLGERDGLGLLVGVGVLGHDHQFGHTLSQAQRGLHRLGKPPLDALSHHQPVNHHRDAVHLVAGQVQVVDAVVQLDQITVHDGPGEPVGGQFGQHRVVGALATPHHRGQHLEPNPLVHLHHPIHDLLGGLAHQPFAGLGIMGDADAGEQQPQVVVHLGDGPHRGARIAGGAFLVDGDGGRQAVDEVHIGLVHLAQELPGIGRQRLHVAALPLGVDGVEGQRRLARTGDAGEYDELVAGYRQMDVAQVVLTRTMDDDLVGHAVNLSARADN